MSLFEGELSKLRALYADLCVFDVEKEIQSASIFHLGFLACCCRDAEEAVRTVFDRYEKQGVEFGRFSDTWVPPIKFPTFEPKALAGAVSRSTLAKDGRKGHRLPGKAKPLAKSTHKATQNAGFLKFIDGVKQQVVMPKWELSPDMVGAAEVVRCRWRSWYADHADFVRQVSSRLRHNGLTLQDFADNIFGGDIVDHNGQRLEMIVHSNCWHLRSWLQGVLGKDRLPAVPHPTPKIPAKGSRERREMENRIVKFLRKDLCSAHVELRAYNPLTDSSKCRQEMVQSNLALRSSMHEFIQDSLE